MQIQAINNICPGFFPANTVTTIQITYSIPSGTQKSYHYHPGTRYSGTSRTAYLPNNIEGRHLLSRLKYAFTHGLTFVIGTSLTTHQPNCVVWSSIHHKTSLSGGAHGFPDASYIDNTNESLDSLNVPEAAQLEPNKRQRSWQRQQRATAPSAAAAAAPSSAAAAAAPSAAVVVPPASVPATVSVPARVAAAVASSSSSIVPFVVVNDTIPYNPPLPLPPGYGTCPGGGTMLIEPVGSQHCPGFSLTTTIIKITYSIPNGIQQTFHDNPGVAFRGTSTPRIAYLPNNDDGRKLLKRLKFAWTRGWIFTIGTSMTSGKSNVVIWSTVIPHKTSLYGGPFGFPDAHYMTLCNQSLDALQVPPFHACP
jgi:Deltex C-terminal domain